MNTELEELACLYVLDRLDPDERAAFEARLLEDSDLATLTQEFEGALAQRIGALPQHAPPPGLGAHIEARIDRLESAGSSPDRSIFWAVFARWAAAALVAAGVGAVAFLGLHRPSRPYMIVAGLDSSRSTLAEIPIQDLPKDADASFIQLASLAEKFWKSPAELPVKVASGGKGGNGYALFDPSSNQGFIAIRTLPSVEQGKRYCLWVLDTASGQTRDAGALPLSDSNPGLYFFSVAPSSGVSAARLEFFVTAEDAAGNSPGRPKGKVVLGDKRF
jgi:anti-sigma-K factor RskA